MYDDFKNYEDRSIPEIYNIPNQTQNWKKEKTHNQIRADLGFRIRKTAPLRLEEHPSPIAPSFVVDDPSEREETR